MFVEPWLLSLSPQGENVSLFPCWKKYHSTWQAAFFDPQMLQWFLQCPSPLRPSSPPTWLGLCNLTLHKQYFHKSIKTCPLLILNLCPDCPPPHPKRSPLLRLPPWGLAGRRNGLSCFKLGAMGGFLVIYDLISVPEVNSPNWVWKWPQIGFHKPPLALELGREFESLVGV